MVRPHLLLASFMGSPSMNFIPCEIVEQRSGLTMRMETGGATFPLPEGDAEATLRGYLGKEVIVDPRPEKLTHMADRLTADCPCGR